MKDKKGHTENNKEAVADCSYLGIFVGGCLQDRLVSEQGDNIGIICGSAGSGNILDTNGRSTGYFISATHELYSDSGQATGYSVRNKQLYGPSPILPWMKSAAQIDPK